MSSVLTDRPDTRRSRTFLGVAAVAGLSVLTLGMGASAANAATFTAGHTDIVSVSCDSGALTIDTYREDGGHIPPSQIGTHSFLYDDSAAPAAAITYSSGAYRVSSNEIYEEDIPFIGFQYASATGSGCPASISVDVLKASGTNSGNASITGEANPDGTATGSTSSANTSTSRVTVWKPGTAGKLSHVHGEWTFQGPQSGADFTLGFNVYKAGSTAVQGSISPVKIRVQP
ncbi:hypothetical protein [uncultured Microbacterium sp.]|uniref:hypothetical protein n=1 Tax=uncultured Microbacterium sp. TaxID=191216 RepID=UPI0028D07B60|nr:hypothetical protein [uncultured Microbacterium sp.]